MSALPPKADIGKDAFCLRGGTYSRHFWPLHLYHVGDQLCPVLAGLMNDRARLGNGVIDVQKYQRYMAAAIRYLGWTFAGMGALVFDGELEGVVM